MNHEVPTLEQIQQQLEKLGARINTTPVQHWQTPRQEKLLSLNTAVFLKLELFQKTGTFKLRAALPHESIC